MVRPVYSLSVQRWNRKPIDISAESEGFVLKVSSVDYDTLSDTFAEFLPECTVRIRFDGYTRVLEVYNGDTIDGKPEFKMEFVH